MDSHKRQNWFRQLAHPSEEELLRFLDGELGEKQAAKVRTHLESCWDCRVKREETECSILAFVGYRKAALAQAGELPPRARLSFEQRLSRLAEASKESNGRRLLSQWRSLFSGSLLAGEGFLARNAMRLATAAVVCVILLFVFLRLDWERPVSAEELLRRMEQAETQRLNRVAHPVIYQKLKVRRQSGGGVQTVTWETWRDLGDPGEH
ncbi:MAG: zf-HC2 domain-containing protein, partial [Blastocatellia bacterium]